MNVYVGDLHLGNVYSDIKSFFELMEKVKAKHKDIHEIIFTGDVVDGLEKYETQKYKQYPETLEVQYNLLKLLLYYLEQEFPNTKVVLVLGNHDRYFYGVLFDKELLESRFKNVKIVDKYVDGNKVLNIHQLGGRVGGEVGWSPTMLQRAKTMLLAEGKELKGLVTAHIHKGLSILKHGKQIFVTLPAFLMDEKEIARNVAFNPTILALEVEDGSERVEIYEKDFNDLVDVKAFNDELISCIRKDYKKCLDIIMEKETATEAEHNKDNKEICIRYGKSRRCVDEEAIDKVRELLEKGYSIERISKELNISKPKVYAIIEYLKQGEQ